ncbi:hypothetical protein [Pseudoalteromonas luteoviolacea]|uniref:Uncharacterized protein n=1 Tax=Pseudoalteromonas luteoviolacea S4054 TaxID=1129367 RepID=A0A0F6ADC3_9GAMM|nr:hypothetical protein [Pseudoalteromonas luteoviolacea]AOT08291.1 hypothetical protein S4054249_10745 [Pseudoalteromonas luteoviolacea]AOT13207.1 hypothetical protein S40542_10720 [Pseudoalteromonas luteoviolacea]AOT18120.1 hypothetical protein S4054_10720 [Pseudoalteromonas luteoviolacea]KKE84227.1 hypothetical protein N479_10025 [Pseudoalteromonas luteoviolacea S4054]KZN76168.1 hypothetical protein N481_07390 [Pseudoalteromonas luteoviolacea S4047-1]
MNMYKPFQGLCLGLALLSLSGCLDNDDDDPVTNPVDQSTKVTVTPSLGLIKNADVQLLTLANKQVVEGATGSTGEDGTAIITVPSGTTGPFIVEVKPTAESEYFDESKGQFLPLPSTTTLRAVMASLQDQVGVTTLTEIAANSIISANVVDATSVNAVNEQIKNALAPALDNILQAPQLVSENVAGSINNDQAGIYATTLAGLAKLGSSQDNPAIAILNSLKADFLDNVLDGKVGDQVFENPVYNADTFVSDLSSQISAYANSFGVAALSADINGIFSLDDIKKTLEGLEDILKDLNLDDISFDFIPGGLIPGGDDDDDDDQGSDDTVPTLTITGTSTTAGISVNLPEIKLENIPAPNPEDLGAIEQQIKTQIESQGITVSNFSFQLVSADESKLVVSVQYTISTQGVTSTSDLTYTWTPGYSSDDNDDSDDSNDVLPDALKGKVFTLTFAVSSNSGSPYSDGQVVEFTFSSSGALFIDPSPDAQIQIQEFEKVDANYVYTDEQNGFKYSVSVLNEKLNEVNLSTLENVFLGQFTEKSTDGQIENLELITEFANTYTVTGTGHSRGTVIIESGGTINFDTGLSFDTSMIVAIFDRRRDSSGQPLDEPRIQVNYGDDDDGPVIMLFLNEDLESIKMFRYRNINEDMQVDVTVVTATGGSGG